MSFIDINGAQIFYETFGKDHPDRAPIVLIHGSTGTGKSNWSFVAPLLAREYRVIVPDCRGHGESSNPKHTYSFKEIADDTAALVQALGYRRAHVIGHSNGGNVALVTLIEHPEIVQTAVLQAANAYVSADLVEKEPAIFDPDRVAREKPEWMNAMIALHGAKHGKEYWRDLLRITLREIIAEPNYSAEDLAQVRRPTFVIQGELDRVNAPMAHGQFISKNIPSAELWIPKSIGHTVHDEMLFEWITRILGFLGRRGDDANDAIYRLERARYDSRVTVFTVTLTEDELAGQVLTREQMQAAIETVAPFTPQVGSSKIKVLLTETAPGAMVNRAVADVSREPHPLAERVSQARLGEVVRLLEQVGDWVRVQLTTDGYVGWMRSAVLYRQDDKAIHDYEKAGNALVQGELVQAYANSDRKGGEVGKLSFGITVPIIEQREDMVAVRLPDGRVWWMARNALLPFAERPNADADGIAYTLRLIRRFVGVPYLWGGRTPFGFDCSGLAQAFWGFMGVEIPRDADQQFRAGKPAEDAARAGDLYFFGDQSEMNHRYERITHVAISLGNEDLIHATTATWGVCYNSLDPAAPNYRAWLRENLVGIRRFR